MSANVLAALQPLAQLGALCSIWATVTVSMNTSKSFQVEMELRQRLKDAQRAEETESFMKPIKEWRAASWVTRMSAPPPLPFIRHRDSQ